MWHLGNRFFLERRDNMEKYEGPILEYDDGEGGGDLIQPMCCNTAVVGGVYAAVVAWDAVGAVNWAGYLNGIVYVNAGVIACD